MRGRSGSGGSLQLNDIREFGKNFRRDLRRSGIDERLPRIIWMDGIGDDALARVESVGNFGSGRFIQLGTWEMGFGFATAISSVREIFDGTGPGELSVVEGGVVRQNGVEERKRGEKKDDVPESGGEDGAPGHAALDPAVLEIIGTEEIFRNERPRKESADVAGEALMEIAPGDAELGLDGDRLRRGRRFRDGRHARSRGRAALSQEVVPTVDLAQRHELRKYSVAGARKNGFGLARRGCLRKSK